jgi:hypothetical protein
MAMTKAQIESWVWDVVIRLRSRQPIEDTRVELKREWTDPAKAARHIAGLANAAGGDQVLWIIGLDEKAEEPVIGVATAEYSNWWSHVCSRFDELAPHVEELTVPVDDKTLMALLIDTDRAPFVTTNPSFGTEKTSIEREVPWREGQHTRSARRSDLIRLLAPRTARVEADVLGYDLEHVLFLKNHTDRSWRLEVDLYLRVPPIDRALIFPDHQIAAYAGVGDAPIMFRGAYMDVLGSNSYWGPREPSIETAERGYRQTVVHASGPVRIRAESTGDIDNDPHPDSSKDAWAEVSIQAVGANRPLVVRVEMPYLGKRTDNNDRTHHWGMLGC